LSFVEKREKKVGEKEKRRGKKKEKKALLN
jgi:hypothetical protein